MTREQLEKLMDEFYRYEGDGIDINYAIAEWACDAVPDLFNAINILLDKLAKLEAK